MPPGTRTLTYSSAPDSGVEPVPSSATLVPPSRVVCSHLRNTHCSCPMTGSRRSYSLLQLMPGPHLLQQPEPQARVFHSSSLSWVDGTKLHSWAHRSPQKLAHSPSAHIHMVKKKKEYKERVRVKTRFNERNKKIRQIVVIKCRSTPGKGTDRPNFTHYQPFSTLFYLFSLFILPASPPPEHPPDLQSSAVSAPFQCGLPSIYISCKVQVDLPGIRKKRCLKWDGKKTEEENILRLIGRRRERTKARSSSSLFPKSNPIASCSSCS